MLLQKKQWYPSVAQDSCNSYKIQVQLLQLTIQCLLRKCKWISLNGAWQHQVRESYLSYMQCGSSCTHFEEVTTLTCLLLLLSTALHNVHSDFWPCEESRMWQVKSGRLESKQIVKGGDGCERKKVSPKNIQHQDFIYNFISYKCW